MRLLAWALLAGLAACFNPTQLDGAIACGPDPDPCPPGMECRGDGLCWFPSSPAPDTPDAKLPACSDGIDNDCDGLTDWPDDPGCSGPDDDDEHGDLECDDGIDNDNDGHADFHIGMRCGPGDKDCKDVRGKERGGPGPGPGPGADDEH